MDILLIGGLWLDGSAWDDVVPELEALGHHPVPIALPGQGDGSTSATLDDQVATVLAAIDAASGRPLVVGHSAACTLAWLAADARPERISGVVLIGGFPWDDGKLYADLFEITDGVMPFPGWEPFEGPDSADLSDAAKQAFTARAVPVPEGVARAWCTWPTSAGSTCRSPSCARSSRPPRRRNGSTPATCPSSRGPSTSTWSTSTRATGRCSPARQS